MKTAIDGISTFMVNKPKVNKHKKTIHVSEIKLK